MEIVADGLGAFEAYVAQKQAEADALRDWLETTDLWEATLV